MTEWLPFPAARARFSNGDLNRWFFRTLRRFVSLKRVRVKHVRPHHTRVGGYDKLYALEDLVEMRRYLDQEKRTRDAWRAAKAERTRPWQTYEYLWQRLQVKRGWLDRRVHDKTVRMQTTTVAEYSMADVRAALAKDPEQRH